jgi:hypothetical protein
MMRGLWMAAYQVLFFCLAMLYAYFDETPFLELQKIASRDYWTRMNGRD